MFTILNNMKDITRKAQTILVASSIASILLVIIVAQFAADRHAENIYKPQPETQKAQESLLKIQEILKNNYTFLELESDAPQLRYY